MMRYKILLFSTTIASVSAGAVAEVLYPHSVDGVVLRRQSPTPSKLLGYGLDNYSIPQAKSVGHDTSNPIVLHRRGTGSKGSGSDKSKKSRVTNGGGSGDQAGSGSDTSTKRRSRSTRRASNADAQKPNAGAMASGGNSPQSQGFATPKAVKTQETPPAIGPSTAGSSSAVSPGKALQRTASQATLRGQTPTRQPLRQASTPSLTSLSQRDRAMSRASLADSATSPARTNNKFDNMEMWSQMLQAYPSTSSLASPRSPNDNAGGTGIARGTQTSPGMAGSDSSYGREKASKKKRPQSGSRASLGSSMAGTSNFGSMSSFGTSPRTSPRGGTSSENLRGSLEAKMGNLDLKEASQPSDTRSNSPTSSFSLSRGTTPRGEAGSPNAADLPSSPRSPQSPNEATSSRERSTSPDPRTVAQLREALKRPKVRAPTNNQEFIAHNKDILDHLRRTDPTNAPAPTAKIADAEAAKVRAKQARVGERTTYTAARAALDTQPPAAPEAIDAAVSSYRAAAREAVHFGQASKIAKQQAARDLPGTAGHPLAEKYVKSAAREHARITATQSHHLALDKEHDFGKMSLETPPRKQGARARWDMNLARKKAGAAQTKREYDTARAENVAVMDAFTAGETSSEDEERPLGRGRFANGA